MPNWDTTEHGWGKILKVDIWQQKLNGKYVGQQYTSDWKSLGHSSEQHNFESVRGYKHVDLAVSLIRGIRQWWRGFYSNTVSLALKLTTSNPTRFNPQLFGNFTIVMHTFSSLQSYSPLIPLLVVSSSSQFFQMEILIEIRSELVFAWISNCSS